MVNTTTDRPGLTEPLAEQAEPRSRVLSENPLLAIRVLENILDGVLIADAGGHIQYINPAFTAITGYSAEEAIGQNPRILKSGHQDEDFYKYMWSSLAARGQWQGEIWNKRKNGEIYPEWENITAIKDSQGRVTHYVAVFSDITVLKNIERRFHHLAHHDPLTGLPNRMLFEDRLQQALVQTKRQQQALAVLFIDLDNFKNINDSYGHAVGDQLMKIAAERLNRCIRSTDTVARQGGDEFIALLTNIAQLEDAVQVAKKIIAALAMPFVIEHHDLFITASVGISLAPQHGLDSSLLVKNADAAMYRAKQQGKNNYQVYLP